MEPIITTAIISSIVTYLAKNLKDNKTLQDFSKDFTSATIHWLRSLLLKDDDTPKEALAKIATNPESDSKRKMLESVFESELEDNPTVAEAHLKEIYEKLTGQNIQNSGTINQNYSGSNSGTVIQIAGNNNKFNQK